jgi:phospholipid/cholesterol/gamma-HCH transport system substrate-binding protein
MRQNETAERHVSRRVGIFTLVALVIFVVSVLEAGVLRNLFRSVEPLHVLLPEKGLSGLSAGATVEVLGTRAGTVREINIDPTARFNAVVEINEDMTPFIRRDSQAFIRKQFGIAGAAYLEITRGQGEPLDWDFPVIEAVSERDPTENIGVLIDDLRARVFPIIEETQRAVTAVADLVEGLEAPDGDLQQLLANLNAVSTSLASGEGSIGRLVMQDTLARRLESALATLDARLGQLEPILANLDSTSANAASLTGSLAERPERIAAILENTDKALIAATEVMQEIKGTVPEIKQLASNTSTAASTLPTFLTQTEETLVELQRLLVQLQGLWLFGGEGGTRPVEAKRLSPLEARQ